MRQLCKVGVALFLFALVTTPAWAVGAATGIIKSTNKDAKQFVLVQENNKEKLYTLIDGAKARRDDKDARFEDFKAGDCVVVLYATIKDGLYALDVCTARKDLAQHLPGKIKEVRRGNQFVVTSEGKDLLITLTDNGIVSTGKGKDGSLSELKPGTDVTVDYIKVNDGLYATHISTGQKKAK